ncbi:MAG: hypothetical protein CVV12_04900 [Gammaproteobacteria bacterium HGW-Gammaproteobacteria-2]|jgi:predicted DNA-binding transcriptional regulator AlpA|nr:MAG: hypothetical protein CVV12_04900 [Gammaproteobacteria bacterium HGW-Gammaproteobacteria-2]
MQSNKPANAVTRRARHAVSAKPAKAAHHDRAAERRKQAAERAAIVLKADGLLRLPEVLALVPVSASTWWQGIRTLRFPAGVRLSSRCTAWRAADIRALLASLGDGAAQ